MMSTTKINIVKHKTSTWCKNSQVRRNQNRIGTADVSLSSLVMPSHTLK